MNVTYLSSTAESSTSSPVHHDLEDLICRVRWMSDIAWQLTLDADGPDRPSDARTRAAHAIRAAAEAAEALDAAYQAGAR